MTVKPSADAARVYAILALIAAGRRVDRSALEDVCALLGLTADPDWVRAMLLLLDELGGGGPADDSAGASAVPLHRAATKVPEAAIASNGPAGVSKADGAEEPAESPPEIEPAFYVYGFVEGDAPRLDLNGLEGKQVDEVRVGRLAALGHPCPASPYASSDESILMGWIKEHDRVLATALAAYEAVVPCRFNTLFRPDALSAVDAVSDWLRLHYEELLATVRRVAGRREYVVRVRWDEDGVRARLIRELDGELHGGEEEELSDGLRYLHHQRTHRDLAVRYQAERSAIGHRILDALSHTVEEHIEEGIPSDGDEDGTVLRCAFLVHRDRSDGFVQELDRLEAVEDVAIEVSGPWPAYSFVNRQGGEGV